VGIKMLRMISKNHIAMGLAFLTLLSASFVSAAQCSSTTDASTLLGNDTWGACEGATPDALEVSFYKLALCTAKPTITDDSACTYFLNTTTPVKATISVGTEIPLLSGDISIPEGVYTHSFLMIDTTIGLKTTFEFAAGNEQYDGAGKQGKYCWTNGNDIVWGYPNPADMPITCGSNPAPATSEETFKAFGCDDNDPCDVTNTLVNQQTTSTVYDVYLLKDDATTLASVGRNRAGYPEGDAQYIWGVQKFNNAPKVDANTSKVTMGFKLTEGMDMGFNSWSCAQPCFEGVNITGFQFTMSTE
jgi:hypothetical protein